FSIFLERDGSRDFGKLSLRLLRRVLLRDFSIFPERDGSRDFGKSYLRFIMASTSAEFCFA
ncbi:hypothetical protein, partial [Agrobacterium sp. ST15.13.040]|uniref:hypothetical protein n=1 Tax=Agrobacterium sp. ST15.13.040 TaxID=3017318 RepID=UPI0022EC4CBB